MAREGMRSGSAAGGQSLTEVLVSLTVFIGILLAVLFVFNLNYRLARDRAAAGAKRTALLGTQHDLVRLVRQAGRSGLPHELAIEVATNVPTGTTIGGPGTPPVVAGTDLLTLRGVFSTPLFQVQPAAGAAVLEIRDRSPQTGAGQSLAELAAAIEAEPPRPDSLLLVSALGGDDANLAIDLVGGVADLQVALGVDLDGSGRVDTGGVGDEWLFNDRGDDAGAPRWSGRRSALDAVRLTCVAQDPVAESADGPVAALEDRPPGTTPAGWRLEAVVDL